MPTALFAPRRDVSLRSAAGALVSAVARVADSQPRRFRRWRRFTTASLALGLATTALAQFGPARTVLGGLDNPRGLTVGPDGALHISGAGRAGTPGEDTPSVVVRGSELFYDQSGSISRWQGASKTQVLSNLPMLYNPGTGEVTGVHGVGVGPGGDLYYTVGLGTAPAQRVGRS